MKRSLMLFLATALMVFSLASCGCSAQQAGTVPENSGQNNSAVTDSSNSGTANSGNGTEQFPNDPMYDSDGNIIDETVDDFTGGVTYEEMLRNGRVHDRDGFLKDGENASVNTRR